MAIERCIACGAAEAVCVWESRPGGRNHPGWTRCTPCARAWRDVCREVDAERTIYKPEPEDSVLYRDADYFVDVVPR